MKALIGLFSLLTLSLSLLSCSGAGGRLSTHRVDLFEKEDSVRIDLFEGKPESRMTVEVDARTGAVPFGVDNAFHVGVYHAPDSTGTGFVYVFSLTPEAVDTVSATTLRYHFTLGRNGRLMLLSARHPEGIMSAMERLDRRVQKGWLNE